MDLRVCIVTKLYPVAWQREGTRISICSTPGGWENWIDISRLEDMSVSGWSSSWAIRPEAGYRSVGQSDAVTCGLTGVMLRRVSRAAYLIGDYMQSVYYGRNLL